MKKLTSILLIIIMLFTATSFTGCMDKYAIQEGGFNYPYYWFHGPHLGLRSVSDTFPGGEVFVDLFIGLKRVQPPLKRYFTDLFSDSSYVPEITEKDKNSYYLVGVWCYSDIKADSPVMEVTYSLDKLHVIKEISHAEMKTSEKYDYYETHIGGMHYNYSERISLSEYIEKELSQSKEKYKRIFIGIANVSKDANGEYVEINARQYVIELRIIKKADGTIIIG